MFEGTYPGIAGTRFKFSSSSTSFYNFRQFHASSKNRPCKKDAVEGVTGYNKENVSQLVSTINRELLAWGEFFYVQTGFYPMDAWFDRYD